MRPQDKAEIARRFRALRRRARLTQRCLAELIGVCRQAVSEIENKKTLPHYTTWDRFAAREAKQKEARITLPVHWRRFSLPTNKGDTKQA
jgi:DNA-binding XRE family transcriptional regulator